MAHDNITVTSLSPLLNKNEQTTKHEAPNYTDQERKYYGRVIERILRARDDRDQPQDEFDGMTYIQRCTENRKGANTYVRPKKTKSDNNFVSGTIRQKIFTYLAAISMLNLSPDIQVYDKDENMWAALGEAMEDMLFKLGEMESEGGEKENRLLRQYQMLEQGEVFVREMFGCEYVPDKKIEGEFDGRLKSVSWKTTLKKMYEGPVRKIIPNENVILGNIHEYSMHKQPFIVDIEIMPYSEGEAVFGQYDRWKFVPKVMTDIINAQHYENNMYGPGKLYEGKKDYIEIVRYQDRFANEQMLFINGVMMMPVGMPMDFKTYDINKQVGQLISPDFAYGKSIVFQLRNNVLLADELIRLALKKTQKSFAPPLANNTGRTLSQKVFAPGTITAGLDPSKISPLDPNPSAVSAGEVNMIERLQKNVDKQSVDPQMSGINPSGSPTATQILETQKQAKMMIGLTELTCGLLEQKLALARIENITTNWTKPKKVYYNDDLRKWVKEYRSLSRQKYMEGQGMGQHIIKVSDTPPPMRQQQEKAEEMSEYDEKTGRVKKPVKITYLNPKMMDELKLIYYVTVTPKEDKTDALNKVVYLEMARGAMELFPEMVNKRYLAERYAQHEEENPQKLFKQEEQAPEEAQMGQNQGPQAGVPNLPSGKNRSKLLDLASKTS